MLWLNSAIDYSIGWLTTGRLGGLEPPRLNPHQRLLQAFSTEAAQAAQEAAVATGVDKEKARGGLGTGVGSTHYGFNQLPMAWSTNHRIVYKDCGELKMMFVSCA